MTTREFLEPKERAVVLFIERYHAVSGKTPDNEEILQYINNFEDYVLTEDELTRLKDDFLFQESMRVRGIILAEDQAHANLTPRQMAAAAAMLNLIDRRSDEKKLRDIGVSTEEWATWMQNNVFSTYVVGRAEKLIFNSTNEAHMGLMRSVRGGNIQAIRLYYELTGRYNPEQDNAVNVRVLLGRVLEIIQKHVKDPTVLNVLGADLMQVAIESSTQNPQNIQVGPKVKEPFRLN